MLSPKNLPRVSTPEGARERFDGVNVCTPGSWVRPFGGISLQGTLTSVPPAGSALPVHDGTLDGFRVQSLASNDTSSWKPSYTPDRIDPPTL